MKTFILLALLLSLLLPVGLSAVSEGAPLFLLIEPGSRAGALGSAYVAMADDGFATYWNTGAMAFNRKTQFALMHTNWLADVMPDIYLEYLSWNQYFNGIGNIGIDLQFDSLGEQQKTDEQGQELGTFSSFEFALGFAYGYQLNDKVGLGTNFKFIYSALAPSGTGNTETTTSGTGMSFAFDFGLLWKDLLLKNLDFGLNIQNLGPKITYINEDQADPLPLNWRMGISYHILNIKYNKLSLNIDMNKSLANGDFFLKQLITGWNDDKFKEEVKEIITNFGIEYDYLDLLALRAGYINDVPGEIVGPSFGIGVHHKFYKKYRVGLDMAFQQGGELVQYNKTFSLSVEF